MATLTVGDLTPRQQYTASSGQTVFSYNFPIFKDSDLKVYVGSTLKTLDTEYEVTGAGTTPGGNVTLTSGATAGDIVTINRDLPVARTTDYATGGALLAENLNDDLDKLVMMVQQVEATLDSRAVMLDPMAEGSLTPISNTVAERASKYLAFDATGDIILTPGTTDTVVHGTTGASLASTSTSVAALTVLEITAGATQLNFVDATSSIQTQIDTVNTTYDTKADIIGTIYPIGALYTSTIATNPGTTLGVGTWASFGEGRVLIGVGSGTDSQSTPETKTFTADDEGGEYNHELVVGELAAHEHTIPRGSDSNANNSDYIGGSGSTSSPGTFTNGTSSSGSGTAHNNLQPYIAVYMWKRQS